MLSAWKLLRCRGAGGGCTGWRGAGGGPCWRGAGAVGRWWGPGGWVGQRGICPGACFGPAAGSACRRGSLGLIGEGGRGGCGERAGGLEAVVGVFGQRAGDDVVDGGRQPGGEVAGAWDGPDQVPHQHCGQFAVFAVGGARGQQPKQRAAQRADVGSVVDRAAFDRFGCGVGGGADQRACRGQCGGVVQCAGNAEVGQ